MNKLSDRLQKLHDRITAAVTRPTADAAITCTLQLTPQTGFDMNKVFPPTYKGKDKEWEYHTEKRLSKDYPENKEDGVVGIVILDSIQSCANRMEDAAEDALKRKLFALGNAAIRFKNGSVYSSFRMPHRIHDAAMRDCTINGVDFAYTDIGKKLYGSDLEVAAKTAFQFCPCALLFGCWCSQVNNTSRGFKSGRFAINEVFAAYVSETHRTGGRMDPLKIEDKFEIEKKDEYGSPWSISKVKKTVEEAVQEDQEGDEVRRNKKEKTSKKKASEIGHCNIPPSMRDKTGNFLAGGVSVKWIKDRFTIHLKKTFEYATGNNEEDVLVRKYLVFLGMYLFIEKSQKYEMRSGCSLDRTGPETIFNFSTYGKFEPFELTSEEALELCIHASVDVQHIFQEIVGEAKPDLERVIDGSKPIMPDEEADAEVPVKAKKSKAK